MPPRERARSSNGLSTQSDLTTLYNLAQDGNFKALRTLLHQLEQVHPEYAPLFKICVNSPWNSLEAICEFLKAYIEEH